MNARAGRGTSVIAEGTEAELPLIRLLDALLARYLDGRRRLAEEGTGHGRVRLGTVRLSGEGALIEIELSALRGLVTGTVPVHLEILSTTPEQTELRWRVGEGGLAALAGKGLGLVPQALLDGLVRGWLGPGVRISADRIHLDHRDLAGRLGQHIQ
jgi:hypothetical protein